MGQRRRVRVTLDAQIDLRRLNSVRPAEWRQMLRMIGEHPQIGVKVAELSDGAEIRRMVLDKSKALVYYEYRDDELLITRVHHGSAEKRPLEN